MPVLIAGGAGRPHPRDQPRPVRRAVRGRRRQARAGPGAARRAVRVAGHGDLPAARPLRAAARGGAARGGAPRRGDLRRVTGPAADQAPLPVRGRNPREHARGQRRDHAARAARHPVPVHPRAAAARGRRGDAGGDGAVRRRALRLRGGGRRHRDGAHRQQDAHRPRRLPGRLRRRGQHRAPRARRGTARRDEGAGAAGAHLLPRPVRAAPRRPCRPGRAVPRHRRAPLHARRPGRHPALHAVRGGGRALAPRR